MMLLIPFPWPKLNHPSKHLGPTLQSCSLAAFLQTQVTLALHYRQLHTLFSSYRLSHLLRNTDLSLPTQPFSDFLTPL